MRRVLLPLLAALLAAVAPAPFAADSVSAADLRLVTLSALLADRYQVSGDLRLAPVRPLPAAIAPDADIALLNAPAELAPQILVAIRAPDAAGRPADHVLVLRAELWRSGWTLRTPAATGAPLTLADLDPRPFDALRERDAIVLPAASADAPELDFARLVPAGRLLVWRDVVRRPLVRRGQPVDVVASDGALVVSLRAVALHDAARGDAVRVRNPESRKEFTATVVAESRATVRL